MTEKVRVEPSSAYRLLHPMHTILVSSVGKDGKSNIVTLAWAMPTSQVPPLAAISVSSRRHSHLLIQQTKEFVINIPTLEILREVYIVGTTSGKNHDKFAETKLQLPPPLLVEAGLTGIKGYSIAVGQDRILGKALQDTVTWQGEIPSFEKPAWEILGSFFDQIWENSGLERPAQHQAALAKSFGG